MSAITYASASNFIIDDIVLWDGRTLMGTPGGAGTHALAGMRVWVDPHQPLGLIAWAGGDLDPVIRARLDALNVDFAGVLTRGDPTARAWQVLEHDGRRFENFRTDLNTFVRNMPAFDEWPAACRAARGLHLMGNNDVPEFTHIVQALRRETPDQILVAEPSPEQDQAMLTDYAKLLPLLSAFSPDAHQAQMLTGADDPTRMIKTLLDAGASRVIIRMGEHGSLAGDQRGDLFAIPAVPPRALVDMTGAGNAYCGGLTVALAEGCDFREAALRAAVSASFALEQFGVPAFDAQTPIERDRRMAWVRAH
jgi:sugar/nucleoside kinase (ribokinase family)